MVRLALFGSPMLILTSRLVLALILIAAVPYTVTVVALAVLWLRENFHDIFPNHATR